MNTILYDFLDILLYILLTVLAVITVLAGCLLPCML